MNRTPTAEGVSAAMNFLRDLRESDVAEIGGTGSQGTDGTVGEMLQLSFVRRDGVSSVLLAVPVVQDGQPAIMIGRFDGKGLPDTLRGATEWGRSVHQRAAVR
jgi:hypothetical protein